MGKYFFTIVMFVGIVFNAKSQESPMDIFVSSLMNRMTMEEKIGQLNLLNPGGNVPTGAVVSSGVEEKIKEGKVGGLFGIIGVEKIQKAQKLAVEQSRLGIPLLFGSDIIHGYKTTFPIPLALSCSWDMDMIEQTARIAAREATADGLCWDFSPMVDITRDPRWGRVAEGAGEDPYLGSQIARAMVRGYQGKDLSSKYTLMATVKHFALYGAVEAGRDYNSVDMSRQKMYNEYLPPYKAAVDAGVGCVMSSFNDVDGIPASGNKWLLTDLLRNQWGFNGFVVSDYTSVPEMIAHGMGRLQDVSALALNAGLDMDMVGEGFLTTFEKSLKEGKISEQEINTACRRILEAKYKLGLFDNPYRYIDLSRSKTEILTPENRKASREAAVRSFVLLKNQNQVLPLKRRGTIALIGPLANDQNNMLGTWFVSGDPQMAVPVFEGMKNIGGSHVNIEYAKGANISDDPAFAEKINVFGPRIVIDDRTPEEMIKEALKVSEKAETIVAVIGEASEMTGESSSRSDISLPDSQKKLVRALAATGKPLVLVVMSGRPNVLVEEEKLATAMIEVWHPGIEAGNAIADVLFGDYNPSGKLTMSFPRNVGQIPVYYSHKNTGRPGLTSEFKKFESYYLDVPNSPLFPFGYGLSYTQFLYSNLILDRSQISSDQTLNVSVDVTNTGTYDGEETVQLYIRDLVASMTRPVRELKGFKKVFVKKGETQTVKFSITVNDLAFYHSNSEFFAEQGQFKLFVGGDSNASLCSDFTFSD